MSTYDLDTRNRPVKIGYLVIGLVYLGLSMTWLLNETGVIEPDGYEWLVPAILLGAGLIGLFASLGKGLLSRRTLETQPADESTQNGEAS